MRSLGLESRVGGVGEKESMLTWSMISDLNWRMEKEDQVASEWSERLSRWSVLVEAITTSMI